MFRINGIIYQQAEQQFIRGEDAAPTLFLATYSNVRGASYAECLYFVATKCLTYWHSVFWLACSFAKQINCIACAEPLKKILFTAL